VATPLLHKASSTLSYVHALHVLLCYSSCPRESFAPSTVFVLLLHLTTISTVHLQPACSLHSLLRLQHLHMPLYYSTCLRDVYVTSTVRPSVPILSTTYGLLLHVTTPLLHKASSTLSYVHALHVLLCYSSCPRESFAPSTVFVLLLHLTTISTVHLQPACSLHSLLRLQHFICLSTTVPVYVTST